MYLRTVNGNAEDYSLRQLRRDNPSISFPDTISDATLARFDVYPYTYADRPAYNEDTQTLQAGGWNLVDGAFVRVWEVIDLPAVEIEARKQAKINDEKSQRADPAALVDALEVLTKQVVLPSIDTMDGEEVKKLAPLFKRWRPGVALAVGEVITYQDDVLKVLQAHTTQADWIPNQLPALYTVYRAEGSVAEWSQPAGGHDAYAKGDRVTYQGKTWQSDIDANVWAPGVYGWTEVV